MGITASDQALIDEYKKQYATSQAAGDTAGMNAAHVGAENVRSKYGFTGGADGSAYTPLTAEGYNTAEDYINNIYKQQTEANQAALTAAYNKNVSNINAQLETLPALYNDARNKTASQSEVQRANFNEYAAANGLNSGAGGQAQLSFANTLQGNLSSLDKAQADETSKYNLQLTQLASDYQNALQQALAQGNLDKTKALYQEYQTNKAYLQAQEETDFNRKLTLAQLGAQYGDFSGYAALGFTPEQIAKLAAEYRRTHTTKTTGGSGGSSKGFTPVKSLDNSNFTVYNDIEAQALDLGFGPITYEGVQELVENGRLIAYTDANGNVKIVPNPNWQPKPLPSVGSGLPVVK